MAAYQIATAEQLAYMASVINNSSEDAPALSAYYILTADIDLNNQPWTPISTGNAYNKQFSGTFNGNGHIISNLAIGTVAAPNTTCGSAGLFQTVYGTTIKNVGIVNANIFLNYAYGTVGALAAVTTGDSTHTTSVTNCYATGSMTNSNDGGNIGGLIGVLYYGTVTKCYTAGSVSGGSNAVVGGLAGESGTSSSITSCYSTASATAVTGTAACAGGLIGWMSMATASASNCYATGNITCGNATYIGGLVGDYSNGIISGCYYNRLATQSVSGAVQTVKGVGDLADTTIPKTSAEMKDSGFVTTLNTGYPGTWAADASTKNQGYPILSAVTPVSSTLYTITYDGNGNTAGTVPMDTGAYASGSSATLAANTESLAKTGFTFGGWNDGAGTNYNGCSAYTITGNKTLYATWLSLAGAPIVTISTTASSTTNASSIPVTITFNKSVTGFTVDDVTVSNGTKSNFSGTGATYTVDIAPASDGAVTVGVAAGVAKDSSNQDNTAATTLSLSSDRTAPSVTISSSSGSATKYSPIPIIINFSEGVTGFIADNITVTNGTKGTLSGSISGFTIYVTPSGQGAITVNIAAGVVQDTAGNGNTAATQLSCTYDTVAPTVAITTSASNPTSTSPIPITISFSESVTGFTADNIAVTNGIKGTLSGSGTTYTINVTPSSLGAVTVDIVASVTQDAAGNNNTAAIQLSRIYSNTMPTLTTISKLTGATEDTAYTIDYNTLKNASNAADADSGDTISFRVESVTSGMLTKGGTAVTAGTTTLASGESLIWTPAANANGDLNAFTVKAHDGKDASTTAVQVKVNVSAVNDAPTGTPTITGTASVGSELTASTTALADVDGLGTFSYQWQVSSDGTTGWSDIGSATVGTFTLTASQNGKYVSVRVSYTDGGGTLETLNSASTAKISAALSSDASLTSVAAQTITEGAEAGTSGAPKTASINVANSVSTVAAADIVKHDTGATVTFYGTDSGFGTPEAGSINLTAGGAKDVYIKVAAADSTTLYYKVTINRAAALSSDAGLISVAGQTITAGPEAGTSGAPKTASISVVNAVATVAAADIVKHDAGATVTFYGTDSSFANPEAGSINLTAGGAKDVYIKVVAADSTTLYYKVTINRATLSNSGGGSTTTDTGSTNVEVNGESYSAGTTNTSTNSSGQTQKTVTIDTTKLNDILDKKGAGATVTIPVSGTSDVASGVLTGDMVKTMENKGAILEIQTDSATYSVPASEIDINAVSTALGTNVSLKDITVNVSIAEPSSATATVVADAAQEGGFVIKVPAVNFTITCNYNGQTTNVSAFNSYVQRTVVIPDGVDPSMITTGIVVDPDGTTHHVPTKVTLIDGKYYAVINSLTNSTYTVVWHPMEFADVSTHWAKDAVNNMGSRMVVDGVGNNNYAPDRDITRAEFAAIVVRALGLAPGTGKNSFTDVEASKSYCGYIETASSYGIVQGYNVATFGPNDKITREQAMIMIARAMKITGLKSEIEDSEISSLLANYSDGTVTSEYAKTSIATCLKTGIIAGRSSNTIAPKNHITRAEVAVIVQRLLQKSNLI